MKEVYTERLDNYYLEKIKASGDNHLSEEFTEKQVEDIRNRSITPDTHKSREFTQNLKSISLSKEFKQLESEIKEQNKLKDLIYYIDEYQYKNSATSHVMHFGINIYNNQIIEGILTHNKKENIKPIDTKSISSVSGGNKETNKAENTIFELSKTANESITSFEFDNTKNAILYLNKTNTRTVLVDVFERNKLSGQIEFEKDSPKIHTVVLYRQESHKGKAFVIDPSDATFSYILLGIDDIIICPSNKLQIYKPRNKTGPNPEEFRDCIDASVKLAFSFNVSNDEIKTKSIGKFDVMDIESLKNHSAIKEVTNQNEIYKYLPRELSEISFRVKQSSDTKQVKKITAVLKVLKDAWIAQEDTIKKFDLYHAKSELDKIQNDFFDKSAKESYNDFLSYSIDLTKNILEDGQLKKMFDLELLGVDNLYNEGM
jgi:hypothetical protein